MLKTFAPRGRELPVTVYGPPGLRDLFGSLKRIFGRADVRVRARRAAGSPTSWRGTATSSARSRSTTACRRSATRLSRTLGPAGSTSTWPTHLVCRPGRSGARCRPARRCSLPGGRVVAPEEVLGLPRPGRKLVPAGDTAPFQGVVEAAAAAADLLVHEATFLEDELERARDTSHSTAGDAAGVAREAGVELLGADTPLEPLLRTRRSGGGEGGLPRDGRAEGLRYHRASLQGARNAAAGEGWSAPPL